jgi:hypothetical protein
MVLNGKNSSNNTEIGNEMRKKRETSSHTSATNAQPYHYRPDHVSACPVQSHTRVTRSRAIVEGFLI